MQDCVENLRDFTKNLVKVLEEVSRLETVNEDLYQRNNRKIEEIDGLNKIINGERETSRIKDQTILHLTGHLQTILAEVLASDNLITLRVDMDIRNYQLKRYYSWP